VFGERGIVATNLLLKSRVWWCVFRIALAPIDDRQDSGMPCGLVLYKLDPNPLTALCQRCARLIAGRTAAVGVLLMVGERGIAGPLSRPFDIGKWDRGDALRLRDAFRQRRGDGFTMRGQSSWGC